MARRDPPRWRGVLGIHEHPTVPFFQKSGHFVSTGFPVPQILPGGSLREGVAAGAQHRLVHARLVGLTTGAGELDAGPARLGSK